MIFIQPLLSLFPVSFPVVIRHVARYAPHGNRKISSETTPQNKAEQNLNDRLLTKKEKAKTKRILPYYAMSKLYLFGLIFCNFFCIGRFFEIGQAICHQKVIP